MTTLDALEELYNEDFFDVRLDRHGEVIDVDYDTDNLDEDFVAEFPDIISAINDFADKLKKVKFYDHDRWGRNILIELSDNPTMFSIEKPIDDYVYEDYLSLAIEDFEEETGVEVFLEGRSGRHVCVKDTFDNVFNYDYLKDVQQRIEKNFIDDLNSYEEYEDEE